MSELFNPNNPAAVVVLTVIMAIPFALFVAVLYAVQQRQRRATSPAVGEGGRNDPPAPPPAQLPAAPKAPARPQTAAPQVIPEVLPLHMRTPRARQHTAVAGKTGDGKTYTLFTLLVHAVADGAQVIVSSPQYTDYHPEHQTIDVTALRAAGHFTAYWDLDATPRLLRWAGRVIDERMQLYRSGQPVGHDICIFLGEWGRVFDVYGAEVVQLLLKVLDSGRITNVWISYIEYHSALVGRTGGDSALRVAYKTRLAGNVDYTTWKAFVGEEWRRQPVPQGYWMTEEGLTRVVGPTPEVIEHLAAKPVREFPSVLFDEAPKPAEARNEAKSVSDTETSVSPVAMGKNTDFDLENPFLSGQIAAIAALAKARVVGETKALETVFDVKAGSSSEYQRLRGQLKVALGEAQDG